MVLVESSLPVLEVVGMERGRGGGGGCAKRGESSRQSVLGAGSGG